MNINLEFKHLDQLINKLVAEHPEKDDILSEYELRKDELQKDVNEVLDNTYGIVSEYNQIEADDWHCGCDVAITLKKLKDADIDESPSIDISFCEEHDADNIATEKNNLEELQTVINEEAHKLWLIDENAKFNWKHRKLFEAADI
jgi:hypothetical protein